jgi:hypothetical protein
MSNPNAMNPETEKPAAAEIEPEPEIEPESGHGRMPLVLLLLWIANVSFFFIYFILYGWPDLVKWINR